MLNNYRKLKDWIEKNVPENQRGDSKTIAEAAIWFVCLQEADTLYDGTRKDMARLVQAGMKPTDSTEAVTEYLETLYQDMEEAEAKEMTEWLDENLREHFGI